MGLSWHRISPPETSAPKALREARTCYDHLAGAVAVQIYDFMQAESWLEPDGSALTLYGREQFLKLGIPLSTHPGERPVAPVWTGASGGFIWAVKPVRRCSCIWKARAGSSG